MMHNIQQIPITLLLYKVTTDRLNNNNFYKHKYNFYIENDQVTTFSNPSVATLYIIHNVSIIYISLFGTKRIKRHASSRLIPGSTIDRRKNNPVVLAFRPAGSSDQLARR